MNSVITRSPPRILYFVVALRDQQLVAEALAAGGLACDLVPAISGEEFQAALVQKPCDLILADLIPGRRDGMEALATARTMRPEVPFVFVCGDIGEEQAVECLKLGATDCVFKSRLERLGPAVRRALSEAQSRRTWKQAQDDAGRLRQSEKQLRRFIDSAPAAFAMFDNQMRYLAVSKRWLQDYRLTSDIIGISHYDIFPEIPEHWKQVHRRGLAGAIEHSEEDRFVRSDGTVSWLRWEIRPWLANAAEIGGITIFTEDITERKRTQETLCQNEERLRLVLQASSMGTFEVDLLTGEGRWNATEFELLGLKPGDAPSHPETFFRFVHPEDIGLVRAQWEEALRVGKLDAEFRIVRADGEVRWLAARGQFVFEGKTGSEAPEARGPAEHFLGVNFDITARRRAEEEVHTSREQLRGLAAHLQDVREEERTRVAREIHDVLAQELTAIKMDIAWLDRRLAQPLEAEKQKALPEKLAAMTNLVDTAIQSVQKIAAGLRPVVLDSLGLSAAVEWQAADFQASTEIRCMAVVPAEDLSLDRERSTAVFRILQESLTNVARHAQATEVQVRLFQEAGELILTVQDNGRGIRASELNNPHSLGLVGLRERAWFLDGQCQINGQTGEGTTVELRIPLSAAGKPEEKRS